MTAKVAAAIIEPRGQVDIDEVLHAVKKVRASMSVMLKSIAALYEDDFGYFEADAMISMIEGVCKSETDGLNIIIGDLRKGGAKDYAVAGEALTEEDA